MEESDFQGIVISSSRRNASVLIPPHQVIAAKIGSKLDGIIAGDHVSVSQQEDRYIVVNSEERKNCLSRTLGPKTKQIAANLDRLILVAAVEPLFNTNFVDRVLLVCSLQEIPVSLVLNKTDLGLEGTNYLVEVYESIGIDIIKTSTKTNDGLKHLLPILANPDLHTVTFAGVSGVGKSSLLNRLIPEAQQRTASVSRKTGQGTQTTSMAEGYLYERSDCDDLLIIDLPGIQNFGVSNLNKREVAEGFHEFAALAPECEYSDCQHTAEPNCAVLTAVDADLIAPSRYLSYLGILDEIEAHKPF